MMSNHKSSAKAGRLRRIVWHRGEGIEASGQTKSTLIRATALTAVFIASLGCSRVDAQSPPAHGAPISILYNFVDHVCGADTVERLLNYESQMEAAADASDAPSVIGSAQHEIELAYPCLQQMPEDDALNTRDAPVVFLEDTILYDSEYISVFATDTATLTQAVNATMAETLNVCASPNLLSPYAPYAVAVGHVDTALSTAERMSLNEREASLLAFFGVQPNFYVPMDSYINGLRVCAAELGRNASF